MYDDTIAAIATAPGEAGIGVVRLSGPEALAIARRLFEPSARHCAYDSHRLYHGHVQDGNDVVDEVLLAYMRAPRSYTAEDVVEIHGHGGPAPLERILHLAIASGARLANPGEFTLRAFINGRLDLTQAEAVADVIQARSESSLRLAVNQLSGRLSAAVDAVQRRILGVMAHLEANIDFSEDDVPQAASAMLLAELGAAEADLRRLLEAADEGILYRRGAHVAIAGRPNAGKSSLLNALLRTNRAIVTPVAGTTRDTIEETISLRGLPVVLVDTAGITETEDPIEVIGVHRSKAAIQDADLVLMVYDASVGWTSEDADIANVLPRQPLCVANKRDLLAAIARDGDAGSSPQPSPRGGGAGAIEVSALTGEGLPELEGAIRSRLVVRSGVDDILVNNLRHKTLLEHAAAHVADARASVETGRPADFIAIDLRAALTDLGTLTGTEVSESLLDEIFSRFCIGK
ncbi:MAG TPA: tRNA uridine-5-carboxymethylaminomethyl(34) synthesis GTPase MnmE [Chloroflexota bacterium]|nr:tRNA uridine-5-carboxymethylaminomethyl(34) synthesis GTPase MnmE [Chloroflexota bacterium]